MWVGKVWRQNTAALWAAYINAVDVLAEPNPSLGGNCQLTGLTDFHVEATAKLGQPQKQSTRHASVYLSVRLTTSGNLCVCLSV